MFSEHPCYRSPKACPNAGVIYDIGIQSVADEIGWVEGRSDRSGG